MITQFATLVRRAGSVLTVLVAVVATGVAVAGPAAADVPEGWSNPDDVDMVWAVLVLGGVPALIILSVFLLFYLPPMIRGESVRPGGATYENQWLGGPSRTTAELAAPDDDQSAAGGASARW